MTNTYLATSVGVPLQVMPFSGARAPRSGEIPASAGGRNLTLAMPPEWTHVKNGPVPNCLRSLGFTKGDKDNAWDLDLRDGNTEENNEYAANLCAGCPIMEQCLSAAMEEEGTLVARNRYLIRGGLTPAARYELATGATVRPKGRPKRDITEGCGFCHEGECVFFDHPNGSKQCRTKVAEAERKRRASKKVAA